MNKKRLLILAAILALLAGLAFWRHGGWRETAPRAKSLFSFQANEVTQIQCRKNGQQTTLLKKDGRWFVREKEQEYRALGNIIEDLLKKLAVLQVDRVASRQKEKHALFEVDEEKGRRIKLIGKGGKVLADFFLGKQGADYMSDYLRLADSQEVLVTKQELSYLFRRSDWRERRLFQAKVEDIRKLTLTYPKEEIVFLQTAANDWRLQAPLQGVAPKKEITRLFSTLNSLRAVKFPAKDELGEKKSGLEHPTLKISWETNEGESSALLIGNLEQNLRYAKRREDSYPVQVPDSRLKWLWEETDKLKQPAPGEKSGEKQE